MTLKLHLLGQVYMEKDGARVALPFKKAEAVVLYIAIEGPRPVEKVKCLFWGDSSERQAAGSLRNAVYLLRKLLPENFEACDGRLFLKNYTTDVDQLCTLRDCETPAVVFDEPLCGFESLTLPDFDEWLAYAAGRVRERLVRWLWDKAAASAVEEKSRAEALAAVLRLDPFDEEAALELMKSHIAQGKAAKAVCLYETFCARLMSEARVPPGPALRAFAEQTALELTDRRWHADEIFCGRCAELKKLADTARRQQGRLQLYFIHGEAGVGKTALVRRAVGSMSGEDAPVFTASAVAVGEKFAYSAWENIVSQLVNRLRESGMTPPAEDISVLSRYFYELAKCENYCAVLLPRGRETLTIARILARFAERLSRGRRAFFIFEDLHWFDALSMKLLRLFIAELRTQTTVFMTSRPQSAETIARTLYGVKPAVPHSLLILPLAPFTRDEIMQYCRLLLSDSLINEKGEGYFVRESEGMPLLLVEMTKMLAENKDADCRCGLRGLIMARMAELSEKEREILDLLSVFGGPVCAEDLAAAAETGAEAALAAAEELLRMGMIRETEEDGGCALDFLHVNVRECVYDAIPGFKRKR
ncbi:MAG: AAA family ATPase, partial [Cloacibacillus sp.]